MLYKLFRFFLSIWFNLLWKAPNNILYLGINDPLLPKTRYSIKSKIDVELQITSLNRPYFALTKKDNERGKSVAPY